MRLTFVLLGGLLAAGVVVALRSRSREPIQISLPPPHATELRVHVAGAVVSPGVYSLRGADRVEDALRAAGGVTEEADLSQVNLAGALRDAQQITVPVLSPAGTSAAASAKLNLNRATLEDLRAVAGIGDVRARRIIQSREQDGAYQDPVDLIERRILTPALYQRVRDTFVAP
jgi:competence protein ComEA